MAVGFCFGDILCVGRGSAAPVLRLWLLLQREGGEPGTLQNAGGGVNAHTRKGMSLLWRFSSEKPRPGPFQRALRVSLNT